MPYPYEAANSYDSTVGKQNVETKNTPAYFTAAVGATQLKSGQGYIDLVSGIPGTGAVNLYDLIGTTASLANQIGSFPAQATSVNGGTSNTQVPSTVFIHGQFNNGLYANIVSTATTFNGVISFS